MHQTQKMSTFVILILKFLLILIPLHLIFIEWGAFKSFSIFITKIETPEGIVILDQLSFLPRTICCLGEMIGRLPLFIGLMILLKLFNNYKKGEIFSLQNIKYYQYLGWLFFLDALVARSLSDLIMIGGATLSNPPGHRYISLSFGTPNVEALFCGLLVLVISWIMREGYRLQEEQKLIV